MKYVLSYKGKILGEAMSREMAEATLVQMSSCFEYLEIVEASDLPKLVPVTAEGTRRKQIV